MKYAVINNNTHILRNFDINKIYDRFAFTKIIYKSKFKNIEKISFFSITNKADKEIVQIPPSYYTFDSLKSFIISHLKNREFKKFILSNLQNINNFTFIKNEDNYEIHLSDNLRDCLGFQKNTHKYNSTSQAHFKQIPSYFKMHCDQIDSNFKGSEGVLLSIKNDGLNFYTPSYLDWNKLFTKKIDFYRFYWPDHIEILLAEMVFCENMDIVSLH